MKCFSRLCLLPGLLALAASGLPAAEPEVLAYWSFNNVDRPLQGRELGAFSENDDGSSGERYEVDKQRILGNSFAKFSGEEIWMSVADLGGAANGGTLDESKGNWGAFAGTLLGELVKESGRGGAFLVLGSKANNERFLTFRLSSKGYKDLRIHYADRNGPENSENTQVWSYSLGKDGPYREIADASFNDTNSKFTERSFSLPGELDDREEFFLRVTFYIPKGGSSALDNMALYGSAIR